MEEDLPENLLFDLSKCLPHLPADKQRELARVLRILFEEFEAARGRPTQYPMGRILHVVLFGSFATGKWVADDKSGYMSDYDLLVVVNNERYTDMGEYWHNAEERLYRQAGIRHLPNFIVHDLRDVNDMLARGQYFFSDIAREGIPLYELTKSKKLVDPGKLDPVEAKKQAQQYFEDFFPRISTAVSGTQHFISESALNDAAFMLHQAVERACNCFMLVHTLYAPPSHNIKFLRSLCESMDSALIPAWERDTRQKRARFELLKRAYVEARYSANYKITKEELEWLITQAVAFEAAVQRSCERKLAAAWATV